MFGTALYSRIVSVDVLRGLTIALMILVNDPGDWTHTYAQLDHAAWNGFTLTDFVFPNFLFLVGVSIILSLQAGIARSPRGALDFAARRNLALRILRRAALLFAVKIFLSAYPHFHLTHLRLFGVLTRIALCYLAAALLCLYTQRVRTLLAVTVVLLAGYWILVRFVPLPGLGTPTHDFPILDPDRNIVAFVDRGFNRFTQRWLHTGALYSRTRDPEGLLSTLPAIASTLIGCVAGLFLRSPHRRRGDLDRSAQRGVESPPHFALAAQQDGRPGSGDGPASSTNAVGRLAIGGLLALLTGLLWNDWFPINKNLWTSSYVLFAAGWSLLLLALCHWLFDLRRFHESPLGRAFTLPWLIYGSNALAAFVLSNFIVETLLAIRVPNSFDPARPINAWIWLYRHFFAAHGSTQNTSLAFAMTYTALCLLPNWILWRRRKFLRL